jgi:hypothetical protein
MKHILTSKNILLFTSIMALVFFIYNFSKTPSLNRNWTEDQKVLASIDISGDIITIESIRDFEYESADAYTPNYIDEVYDVREIESLYYIIEPFGAFDGPAHTMLSFGFSDGEYLVISAEIRKEQ